ncbi:MAG: hypothetical protein ABJ275_12055 [Maricaulaceae bacterium]
MKKLLLGVAAIGLSGCTWLGIGTEKTQTTPQYGQYNQQKSASNDCCVGGKTLSRWNVEAAVGPEFFIGGDAISGDEINDIPGTTSTVQSFGDVFDDGIRYDLGASYALNPNRKVTGNIFYGNANGNERDLGIVNGETVRGTFSDYERYGAELGLRQYSRPVGVPLINSIRPYVEGKVGAARVKSIDFVNSDANAVALAGTTPFYEGTWVPTAAGLVGIETPVFNRFTVGIESGIRYTGGLDTDTSVLGAGVPLAGTNNGGGAWTVPVQIRGRYRF